jgi:hypothetical protein
VEQSWAWYNGYKPDTMQGIGNGNGFKAGGYGADPAQFPANPSVHVVRQCLAFMNKAAGFYANHHPVSALFYNNTSYGNHPDFNMLGMNAAGQDITVGVYRNNLAFGGTLFSNRNDADDASNSWTLPGLSVSDVDFQNVMANGMDAARQGDGSLPTLPNFHLAAGSDVIDAGTDLKLPFAGKAPDLGAFEVGLEATPVGGGASGGSANGGSPNGGSVSGGSANGGNGAVSGGGSETSSNSGGSESSAAGSASGVNAGGAVGGSGQNGAGTNMSGGAVGEPASAAAVHENDGCACGIGRRSQMPPASVALGLFLLLRGQRRRRR